MAPQTGTQAYWVRTLHHSEPFANSAAFDGWDLEYTQLSAGRFECESQEVRLQNLQIYTETGNATLHQFGAAWPSSYVFAIPCEMSGEGRVDGQRWCRRSIAAFRGEKEFDALVPPMKLLVASVTRDELAEYLETVEHVSAQEWLKRGTLLMEGSVRAAFVAEALTAVVESCGKDPGMLTYPQVRAAVMQTTLETLAPLILDNLAPPPPAVGGFNRTQVVRRAREFALASIDEPLQIIDVCRALGVSRRTLQYSFQDVLNVNPVAYLRLLRLNGARRDLVNAGEKPVQVKDVVARWGFWHFSRFSAEYKEMFNELPSETLRRVLRSARSA